MIRLKTKISVRARIRETVSSFIENGKMQKSAFIFRLLILSLLFLTFVTGYGNKNAFNFDKIDDYARSVKLKPNERPGDLAIRLTKNASTDIEKARAIFVWLTENIRYDTESYFSGRNEPRTLEEILHSGKSVCQGYSDLFETMSRSAGLEAVTISGWAKGASYSPDTFMSGSTNHAWNAVRIEGKWYLVDCTWGAGYLSGREYIKHFDEFYFFTPPEQLIHTHFPKNNDWQLLEPKMTKEKYLSIPKSWPNCFRCGVELLSDAYENMRVREEETFQFGVNEGSALLVTLYGPDRNPRKAHVFVQRSGNMYEVRTRFAEKGNYELHIYARKETDDDPLFHSAIAISLINAYAYGLQKDFPETYSLFQEREAVLLYPMERRLQANESVAFRIVVPDAEEVVVINGGEWNYLEPDKDVFTGNVRVQAGDVFILARFESDNIYRYLVRYVAE